MSKTTRKKAARRKRAPSPEENSAIEALCTAVRRIAVADGKMRLWPSACTIDITVDDLCIEISAISLLHITPFDDVTYVERLAQGEDLPFALKIWSGPMLVLDMEWMEANDHDRRRFERGTWEHRLSSHAHTLQQLRRLQFASKI